MVIVRLHGGLGNQFFQYATARRISLKYNMPLKLDIFALQRDRYQRTYSFKHFNIIEEFASIEELAPFARMSRIPMLLRRRLFRLYRMRCYIQEKTDYIFDEKIFNQISCRDIYLDGYFQNENYFKDIKENLRKELTLKTKADNINEEISQRILNTNSVCLHLRRLHGFAANGAWVGGRLERNMNLPLDYYYEAAKRIIKNVKDPYFFIFSDNPGWAQENLKLDYSKEFIGHNCRGKDYEDLRLMSLCKHHIIANSTFSWWGAWLAQNPDQLVLAPAIWSPIINSKYIIPDTWYRI